MPDDFAGSTATTGSVTIDGASVAGRVEVNGDNDWFRTTLLAGVTYHLRLNAAAGSVLDPLLAVRSSTGSFLVSNDDGGPGVNSFISYTPDTSGTYYLSARGHGTSTGSYRLSASAVDDFAGTIATAGHVNVNGVGAAGIVETAGDQDWFSVQLFAGVTYLLRANTAAGGVGDPVLDLRNSAGALIASNDDGGNGFNSLISYTPTSTDTYFLAARGFGAHTGAYVVSASVSDDFAGTTATTGSIVVNGAPAAGRIEVANDADWFAVNLTAGVAHELRLSAGANGGLGDPFLELRDGAGALIGSDDNSGGGVDSLINYTPSISGTYFLAARGLSGTAGTYTVAATVTDDFTASIATTGHAVLDASATGNIETGGDQDWFAVELSAGHVYTIQLKGSPSAAGTLADTYFQGIYDGSGVLLPGTANDDFGGTLESRVVFTPSVSGTYFLSAGGYSNSTGTYTLSVTDSAAASDIAASIATTATLAVNGVQRSAISPAGDVDWFRVSLNAGQHYVIEENASAVSGPALGDPYIRGIYNSAGTLLPGTSNDDYGIGLDSRVSFTAPATGTYYVAAGAFGSTTGEYALSLARLTSTTDAVGQTTGTAGAIAVNGTVNNGRIDFARDIDWYRVALVAGQDYVIDVRGAVSGNGTLADPSLVGIYNASGAIIPGSGNDDAPGTLDSQTSFRPSTSGDYYLSIAAEDDGIGTYDLSIRTETDNLDIPANSTTTARVRVGGNLVSQVDTPGDVDWVRAQVTAGVQYRIEERGAATGDGTLADPRIVGIYTSTGQAIPGTGNDDNGTNTNSAVTFTATTSGDVFIAAGAYGSFTGTYELAVTPIAADNAAPLLLSTTPVDNEQAVGVSSNLSLAFNEAVRAGSGNVVITGGGVTRSIPVTDAQQVTFSGEIMTINPAANLAANTSYSVTLASGVVRDIGGNAFAGINSSTQFNFATAAGNAADKWTIMVYMAADNNLEGAAITDLNEMESATLPSSVNVVTLVDRATGYDTSNGNWTDTRRGAIAHDSNLNVVSSPLASQGELNTGAGATLTNFINWAASNHPASHYALVIWDHGGGLSGTSWDDASNGDNLRNAELRTAIDNSSVDHFDLIGFDACLQAMVEQAWDLRNLTDVIVASEELEPGDGWEYNAFLPQLAANPDMTAVNLASAIVTTYGQHYAGQSDITLAAIRTSAMSALDNALDNFVAIATPVLQAGGGDATAIRAAASHATGLGDANLDYRDLGDFMDEVIANVSSSSVDTAAAAVATAVDNAVIARSGTVGDANGLSIYLPFGNDLIDASYTPANHSFLSASSWDNFLLLI